MSELPFTLLVNDQKELHIEPSAINTLDKVALKEGGFHVLQADKGYHAEIIEADFVNKIFIVKVNGTKYTIKVVDKFDRLVKEMGLTLATTQRINAIKAPMPGLVLEVLVSLGQEVKKGDSLLILEAMKMENILKATGEGKIKAIYVSKGLAIDKGQLMLELE